MHRPGITRARAVGAGSANSETSRVLPTPASPARSVAPLCPSTARRSAARRTPSSAARPMKTGLDTRADMPAIIAPVERAAASVIRPQSRAVRSGCLGQPGQASNERDGHANAQRSVARGARSARCPAPYLPRPLRQPLVLGFHASFPEPLACEELLFVAQQFLAPKPCVAQWSLCVPPAGSG